MLIKSHIYLRISHNGQRILCKNSNSQFRLVQPTRNLVQFFMHSQVTSTNIRGLRERSLVTMLRVHKGPTFCGETVFQVITVWAGAGCPLRSDRRAVLCARRSHSSSETTPSLIVWRWKWKPQAILGMLSHEIRVSVLSRTPRIAFLGSAGEKTFPSRQEAGGAPLATKFPPPACPVST